MVTITTKNKLKQFCVLGLPIRPAIKLRLFPTSLLNIEPTIGLLHGTKAAAMVKVPCCRRHLLMHIPRIAPVGVPYVALKNNQNQI